MLVDDSIDRPERTIFPYTRAFPQRCGACWGKHVEVLRCMGSWENYVYEAFVDGDPAILRLTDREHRTVKQVIAELEWVTFLHSNGLPVSRPIPSIAGAIAEEIEDGGRIFIACLFSKCEGHLMSPAKWRELGEEFFFGLGSLIGQLHFAAIHYDKYRRHNIDRPSLVHDDLIVNAEKYVGRIPSWLSIELSENTEWLAAQPVDGGVGLIHGDIHGRNILMGNAGMTVIDFDDCCRGWFAYDLGVTLNWAFPPEHTERDRALDWLLNGYSVVCRVDSKFRTQIDGFIRLRLIQDYILAVYRLRDPLFSSCWLQSRATTIRERLGFLARRFGR